MSRAPSRAFLVIAGILGMVVLVALALRPVPVVPPQPRAEEARRAVAVTEATRAAARPETLRNVFVYDEPRTVAVSAPPAPVLEPSAPPALTLPPVSPVSLVGFVRQGGSLRAAVSIHGDVSVLAKGETAAGYAVLAIDEDRGVTLRGPDGAELTLGAPPAR